jgi:HemY protein
MRRFFWFLIILIVSVWIGLKVAADPGYALFAYQHWTMEMPLWFAVISFIVVVLLLYGILRFFDSIDFSLYRLKNWIKWRRKYKSYSKTNRGLVELIEGHWRSAEYYLLEGVTQSDAPLINYLAAAKAAQEQGAFDRRDNFLRKAHQCSPHAEIAIGLTQAQLQLEQGQLEQALATLGHLQSIAPKHVVVIKLLEKVYIRLSDWNGLLKLLPSLRKAKIINDENLAKLEAHTYQELLRSVAHKPDALRNIHQVWVGMPKKVQKNPVVIYTYCDLIKSYPEMVSEAEELINKSMKKSWDKELAHLYGLLVTSEVNKQLTHAESWNKTYPHQAVLLLTLGRLCMRLQLWGKAKGYLEESLKLEPLAETYQEYGRLLEQMGDFQLALQQYRNGLMLRG